MIRKSLPTYTQNGRGCLVIDNTECYNGSAGGIAVITYWT